MSWTQDLRVQHMCLVGNSKLLQDISKSRNNAPLSSAPSANFAAITGQGDIIPMAGIPPVRPVNFPWLHDYIPAPGNYCLASDWWTAGFTAKKGKEEEEINVHGKILEGKQETRNRNPFVILTLLVLNPPLKKNPSLRNKPHIANNYFTLIM